MTITNTEGLSDAEWLRDTAMNVMLATEVDEATRILSSALSRRAANSAGGVEVKDVSIDHHAYRVAHIDPPAPAVEAEPVAQTERVKLHRKIMGMIADKQRYAGVMLDGRDLHVIAEALLDRAIEVERSSSVSAEVTERPIPELFTEDERATILRKAETLWADLQQNNLGGYSGGNRPFYILHAFKEVIEKYGHRDVGLSWSKNDLDAALAAINGGRDNG